MLGYPVLAPPHHLEDPPGRPSTLTPALAGAGPDFCNNKQLLTATHSCFFPCSFVDGPPRELHARRLAWQEDGALTGLFAPQVTRLLEATKWDRTVKVGPLPDLGAWCRQPRFCLLLHHCCIGPHQDCKARPDKARQMSLQKVPAVGHPVHSIVQYLRWTTQGRRTKHDTIPTRKQRLAARDCSPKKTAPTRSTVC